MRLLVRLIAIVTALSFAGSSTLSAMPLVWCVGNDGHRAVETILHQQSTQSGDSAADEGIAASSHHGPCSDWQLLSTAGPPQAKTLDVGPKALTAVTAYPPLRLLIAQPSFPQGPRHAFPRQPRPGAQLRALRSVVLLI